MPKQFGFSKKERLKSRKQIDELFRKGRSFSIFPLKVIFEVVPGEPTNGARMGVAASKKYFKKAVDRNKIKRLLREAYRLQKQELTSLINQQQAKVLIFFIYTGKSLSDFETIKAAVAKSLLRIKKNLESENPT